MLAKVFLWGGVSALVALVIEYFSNGFVNNIYLDLPRIISTNIMPFLSFGALEEVVKFLFVFVAVRRSSYFDEPIDAMIYTATGALGFAAMENFFLVLSNGFDGVFGLILLRFIGATLLHALASTIVGYYWARGVKYHIEGRLIIAGVVLASIVHTLFNLFVFKFDDMMVYPIVFLMIVGFFVLFDFEELREEELSN